MAILETKHTFSRFNKVKNDLMKTKTTISCFSMLIFLAYYVYLVSQNLENALYLAIYSGLILSVLIFFMVEIFVREQKNLLKNEKRRNTERKRRLRSVSKFFKFTAKTALVVIAIYETVNNFDFGLANIINICSAVFLVLQILFEMIVQYVIKQIDYFRLALELDFEGSSWIAKKFLDPSATKKMEKQVIKQNGEEEYSNQESRMINEIIADANDYVAQKEDKVDVLKRLMQGKSSEKGKRAGK